MPEVEIIECDFNNPAHTDALVYLINHYISDKMGGGKPLDNLQKISLVEGLRNHPSKLILFALSGNTFIGLTVCFINFATFTVKPFINIHDIVVLDSHRNKGIGRLLLQEIIKRARQLDCSKVTLEVREDNLNAQHLYKSIGFEECNPKMYFWSNYL